MSDIVAADVRMPTIREVRDHYAGVGVNDPETVERRYAEFDAFIDEERKEAKRRIADSLDIASGGALPSDPPVRFPAGTYIEEARKAGGRSQWAMRYYDEALLHQAERRAHDSFRRLVKRAIDLGRGVR